VLAAVLVVVAFVAYTANAVPMLTKPGSTAGAPLEVTTKDGVVKGAYDDRDGSRFFHGIPFARPPVGDFRLRAPQPAEAWNTTRDCTSAKFTEDHICPQLISIEGRVMGKEDCLYLSIYTPSPMPAEPVPVMVWLYGGAYIAGDEDEFDLYDGHELAQKHNVIVVAPNYRLVGLGFMAHKELAAEDEHGSTGNYAMLDQRAAMLWVKDNIAAFGGDADKVTIFGESAGGFSVCWHLVSPGSQGLFRAAIMESGSCESKEFFLDQKTATDFGANWTTAAGCDADKLGHDAFLSCVRQLPVEAILKFNMPEKIRIHVPPFYPLMPWGPMYDGNRHALPDLPINMLTRGDFNKVPLLIGTNGDEGTMFTAAAILEAQISPLLPDKAVTKSLALFFNDTAVDLILQRYPHEGISNYPRLAHFLRDWFFTCTTRRTARAVSDATVPTFLYQFVYPDVELHREMGDYHASELPYVFGSKLFHAFPIFKKEDIALRDAIQTYWTNHVHNLNPNVGVKPAVEWPQFTRASDTNLALDVPCKVNTHLEADICNFWDTITTKY